MDINRKTLTAVLVLSAAAGLVYWSMENRGPDFDYNFDEQKEEQLKQNQPEVYQELKDKLDRAESILRQDDKEATAWMDIALSSHPPFCFFKTPTTHKKKKKPTTKKKYIYF